MSDVIYANSFGITTNGENEIFLRFQMNVPSYDENEKYIGMETQKTILVAMTHEGYDSFRNMIDKAESKERSE